MSAMDLDASASTCFRHVLVQVHHLVMDQTLLQSGEATVQPSNLRNILPIVEWGGVLKYTRQGTCSNSCCSVTSSPTFRAPPPQNHIEYHIGNPEGGVYCVCVCVALLDSDNWCTTPSFPNPLLDWKPLVGVVYGWWSPIIPHKGVWVKTLVVPKRCDLCNASVGDAAAFAF